MCRSASRWKILESFSKYNCCCIFCSNNNKASEADFGILDLLVGIKPNANISTMLALIMWSKNKTLGWITEK